MSMDIKAESTRSVYIRPPKKLRAKEFKVKVEEVKNMYLCPNRCFPVLVQQSERHLAATGS